MNMEFYEERTHIARKEHYCEMCGEEIKVGERYWRERGKFYGDFFERCMHNHCHNMEAEYCREVDVEFDWDDVFDYVAEKHCFKCEDEINDTCEYHIGNCPRIKSKYTKFKEKSK